jgi:hypothetical protein
MTRRLYLIAMHRAKTYNRAMHPGGKHALNPLTAGTGQVLRSTNDSTFDLKIGGQDEGYGLAQLDDYHHISRSDFRWRPPLQLCLKAKASTASPKGTLGFGFWNDPFSFSLGQAGAARRFPASPQAVWFFYGSPPNDIALAPPVPGHGWKAAVLRSPRVPAVILAPAALAAIVMAQIPLLRRFVMTTAINRVRTKETVIRTRLDQLHEYRLVWESDGTCFYIDDELVLESEISPREPLGFVAWIDNQYAVASPQGGFRFGVIQTEKPQSLKIEDLRIKELAKTSSRRGDA